MSLTTKNGVIRIMAKVDTWLGITADPADIETAGRVPMWNGVRVATKFTWVAVWLLIGVAAFTLANMRMPEDDGFGGFVPLYLAIFIFISGIALTERSLVTSREK